jgi:hypothetical protein
MDTKIIVNNWVLYNILLNTYFEEKPAPKSNHVDDWIII